MAGSIKFRPVTASGTLLVVADDAPTGVARTGVTGTGADGDAGNEVDGDAGTVVDGGDGPLPGHVPAMVMVWSCDAVKGGELESITVAEKAKVPVPVGVPVTAPDDERVNPGGSCPDADHVKGAIPPWTVGMVAVYAV
jgi:hypothetical protein